MSQNNNHFFTVIYLKRVTNTSWHEHHYYRLSLHKCGSENSGASELLGDGTVMIKRAGQL